MILAKVVGNVIATQKANELVGGRIMLVQPIDLEGNLKGQSFMALDAVDSGSGDTVIVVQEGWSASTATTYKEGFAIDAAIIGVVDTIEEAQAVIEQEK